MKFKVVEDESGRDATGLLGHSLPRMGTYTQGRVGKERDYQ